jgi:hypothetical protein
MARFCNTARPPGEAVYNSVTILGVSFAMRIRSFSLLVLLAFALACASGNTAQRPANISRPEITAELAGDVFFGGGSTAPATIDITVRNTSGEPITVRRIEVDTPDMTEWGLVRQARSFGEVIEPGATKAITFFATASTIASARNEPLTFRTTVEFESAGNVHWREQLTMISTRPPAR